MLCGHALCLCLGSSEARTLCAWRRCPDDNAASSDYHRDPQCLARGRSGGAGQRADRRSAAAVRTVAPRPARRSLIGPRSVILGVRRTSGPHSPRRAAIMGRRPPCRSRRCLGRTRRWFNERPSRHLPRARGIRRARRGERGRSPEVERRDIVLRACKVLTGRARWAPGADDATRLPGNRADVSTLVVARFTLRDQAGDRSPLLS